MNLKIYRIYRYISTLFIDNIEKAIYRGIEGSTKASFIKLREISIGGAWLTRRILWRPIHKIRSVYTRTACTRYYMLVQTCNVLDSHTNVPGQTVPCRVVPKRVSDAMLLLRFCKTPTFLWRVSQAHDIRHRRVLFVQTNVSS